METDANIQGNSGGSVTVGLPKRFSEHFIGKLLALQDEYTKADHEWHLLNTAVKQCRTVNAGLVTFPEIHQLWMLGTQKHLARLGVMVG